MWKFEKLYLQWSLPWKRGQLYYLTFYTGIIFDTFRAKTRYWVRNIFAQLCFWKCFTKCTLNIEYHRKTIRNCHASTRICFVYFGRPFESNLSLINVHYEYTAISKKVEYWILHTEYCIPRLKCMMGHKNIVSLW